MNLFLRIAALVMLAGGCASAGTGRSGTPAPDHDLITAEEIRGVPARDAYDIVQRLRPDWLRQPLTRSARFETVIGVYYNNSRLGDVEALRSIEAGSVTSIRFLDAAQARGLPGQSTQHMAGAIVVSTHDGGS
ncbi:MAG: hypothetical protein JO040_12280 [Gemmatimonadetes bacterium]|nr:hypothetical protein [Gemmatimonadota bacterium]